MATGPEENNEKRQGSPEYRPRFVPDSSQQSKKRSETPCWKECFYLWRNDTLRRDSLVSNAETNRNALTNEADKGRWWWLVTGFSF